MPEMKTEVLPEPPRYYPDGSPDYRHWATCVDCQADFVCERPRCLNATDHMCGCVLPHDVLYPEAYREDDEYEDS